MTRKPGEQFYPCDECESEDTIVVSFNEETNKGTWKCNCCPHKGEFAVGKAISVEEMIKGLNF